MSADPAVFDLNVRESDASNTTFCSPPTSTMFEPGGIKEPEHKTMFLDVLESYILTSTLIFDCILFAIETPITVAVTPVAV